MRIDAALAWDAAARKYRGEGTRANFPLKKPVTSVTAPSIADHAQGR